jgi:methionyl-tRNA formyltransferase
MEKKDIRIVFMGTPAIAVASLAAILDAGYNVAGVVTAPDKPAGRGQKIQLSEVKKFALEKGLHVMQPEKLKSPEFLDQLNALKPDVQVVVAFRMLPETVWTMPPMGTFNLHASLLPQYRGAAPINHAVINGETKTGVTTFFLDKEIDTGRIITRKEAQISENDTAGTVHDRLMVVGAQLVVETLEMIRKGNMETIPQQNLMTPGTVLKTAPKIFREDCRIDWQKPGSQIRNLIRGLNPFPGAFTEIVLPNGEIFFMKIFEADAILNDHNHPTGKIFTDNKKYIRVSTPDGYIDIKSMQAAGKKRMKAQEFLRGYDFPMAEALH